MTGDGERLRRRLYQPGAGGDDVEAFLAVREPASEPEGAPPAAAPRRPPRRSIAAAAAALVIGAAALGIAGFQSRTAPVGPVPTPLPVASAPAAVRAGFMSRITTDRDAGLAAWIDPQAPFVEEHGVGSGTVELPPPSGPGRLTVVLVLASDATAAWSVGRLVIHDDRTIHLSPVDGATGTLRAGDPTVAEVPFTPLTRPARLQVDVPGRVRWGVAAVYRD